MPFIRRVGKSALADALTKEASVAIDFSFSFSLRTREERKEIGAKLIRAGFSYISAGETGSVQYKKSCSCVQRNRFIGMRENREITSKLLI